MQQDEIDNICNKIGCIFHLNIGKTKSLRLNLSGTGTFQCLEKCGLIIPTTLEFTDWLLLAAALSVWSCKYATCYNKNYSDLTTHPPATQSLSLAEQAMDA